MSLGQLLKDARKAAGLTLDQLSTRTNIRASLLSEFEDNNFRNAGGDTYARGHLRSIARITGSPAEELLSAYDSEHAQAKRPIHDQLVENNVTGAISEKSKITYKQLLTASIIGLVTLFFVSFAVSNLRQSANEPKVVASPKASITPTASATPTPSTTPNTYSSGSGVEVKLSAINGSSWLFVTDKANVTLFSGRAFEGQELIFSSTEEVNLRIGNAGAVKLIVNGKEVPPLGASGEVVNVSYGVNS